MVHPVTVLVPETELRSRCEGVGTLLWRSSSALSIAEGTRGVDAYFEYVRSKANVADFPSRFERGKLREALVDAGLGHLYVEWVECVLPTFAEWKTTPPRVWLQRGAEAGRRTAVSQEAPPAPTSKRARFARVQGKGVRKPGHQR